MPLCLGVFGESLPHLAIKKLKFKERGRENGNIGLIW